MTGLEARMEEEIAHQAHRPDEALELAKEVRAQERKPKPRPETEADRVTEEAMHLDR